MRRIRDVAKDLGLPADALESYGDFKGKVSLDAIPRRLPDTPLVVVTAMTPTPAGEGKTTTAIGLVDALARLGRRPVLTLRQPSLGPTFGAKGGGTGGGKAQVVPASDINLHFTGDAHAVASAHNLLAALADAAVYHHTIPGLEADGLDWRRVTNIEDRVLRYVVTGLGGKSGGPLRLSGFDIDAASEIMAVLALVTSYTDLRARLARLVVGYTRDGTPVTAQDLRAVGALIALLKDAMKPNLVQTLEGQPAIVHTGPFGNIAQGCSSILADRLAAGYGDIVVTEAGFGADLGFEKLIHLKTRAGGVKPAAAVVVATVRALRWHGGATIATLAKPDLGAVQRGLANLAHTLYVVKLFGVPAVVAINRFPDDTPQEVEAVKRAALESGVRAAVESQTFLQGGAGALELAQEVLKACKAPSTVTYLYSLEASIEEKVEMLARQVYGASQVQWQPSALLERERLTALGWDGLPICMAKTHLSISADPSARGRPLGHALPITALRVAAGAGFLYPLAGNVQTMPGLPREPRARAIDVNERGEVTDIL